VHSDSIRVAVSLSKVCCRPVVKFSCQSFMVRGLVQGFTDFSKILGARRMI